MFPTAASRPAARLQIGRAGRAAWGVLIAAAVLASFAAAFTASRWLGTSSHAPNLDPAAAKSASVTTLDAKATAGHAASSAHGGTPAPATSVEPPEEAAASLRVIDLDEPADEEQNAREGPQARRTRPSSSPPLPAPRADQDARTSREENSEPPDVAALSARRSVSEEVAPEVFELEASPEEDAPSPARAASKPVAREGASQALRPGYRP